MEILVVEDDAGTREVVARALECAGHAVITAADGAQALELVASVGPDLVVLDVGLPDIDGFEVGRRIRLDSQLPIVVLTARDQEDDVMQAFRLGADDYLTKPFSARVLVARVAAILRRAAAGDRRRREGRLRVGDLELDVASFEVWRGGEPIRLTPLEFRLLHLLAANAGRVVPYGRLVEFAWGREDATPSHLKIRVHALRKKLGLGSGDGPRIKAVTGTGYTLQAP